MPEHTGTGECAEARLEEQQAYWLALYRRRRWRQGDPLVRRRVRRVRDGREGAVVSTLYYAPPNEAIRIAIDWDTRLEGEKRNEMGNENLLFCVVLEPPALPANVVHVRRVLTRGTKEQIAERWAALGPLSGERLEAGERRYVEFDDQPMAYRRWRIVHVSAPMPAADVARIPNEYPAAAALRRSAEDAASLGLDDEAAWAA